MHLAQQVLYPKRKGTVKYYSSIIYNYVLGLYYSSKHGRTFDEIREENRRKQMGNSLPQTHQSRPRNREEQRKNNREPAPSGLVATNIFYVV